MHVYQMRSSNIAIVKATEQRLQICMNALKDVAKVWLVAKMVHTLFESILGNKVLEERLQKAAGRKHVRDKSGNKAAQVKDKSAKRKYDDVDADFSGPPAPQMSYERSRPQSPAVTPSRELPANGQQQGQGLHHTSSGQQMPNITMTSESPELQRHNDAFMGHSRGGTRAPTPFNPRGPSMPGTPPELFLATRHSPTLPQDLWATFQPEQLFPGDHHGLYPNQQISPTQQTSFIDPQLQLNQQQQDPNQAQNQGGQQRNNFNYPGQQQQHLQPNGNMQMNQQGQPQPIPQHLTQNGWAHLGQLPAGQPPQQPDAETWSNSSMSQGPPVPTTLNVEDW